MANKLALIGFGEAAAAFAAGWPDHVRQALHAYDIKTSSDDATIRAAKWADYEAAKIAGCEEPSAALADADAIFSLVTADQALTAAQSAAGHLKLGSYYFDCNSCAPATKKEASVAVSRAHAHYIDVAIMAPVSSRGHQTALLVSGPNGEQACEILQSLGMQPEFSSDEIGAASSVKMIRSIMIKGMEGLFAECVLSARQAGVDEQVLSSLQASDPYVNWRERAAYALERVMKHGERRAAEMAEVAKTVQSLGLSGDMAKATTVWQETIGAMHLDAEASDYRTLADQILQNLKIKKEQSS